jgi:hypothetical protein
LFDIYFDSNIEALTVEELKTSSVPEELQATLKRELRGLSEYFDYDYILRFGDMKKEMTTFSGIIEATHDRSYEGVEEDIIGCICRAADKILEDLKEANSRFQRNALTALREKGSTEALKNSLRESVAEMHAEIFGWPLIEKT